MTDFVSDVPIRVDDGLVLRADVFRPLADGKHPVILTYGPYGKWLHFEDLYTDQWRRMVEQHPDVPAGSTNKYQNWEVVDPEKWVPDGYVCIRIDSRGAGRSPGYLDIWSAREAQDLYHCIEWAAAQPWSNGKIGLNGISYYAMNQWQVAALEPPHLAAICIWEGAADYYRDLSHHGEPFALQEGPQALPDDQMVIGEENSSRHPPPPRVRKGVARFHPSASP